jgi:bacterioferritin-associated ferredoxin
MVVCHCNAVSDREIRQELISGALDADDLAARCGAGARCGGCQPGIEALLAEAGVSIRPARVAA